MRLGTEKEDDSKIFKMEVENAFINHSLNFKIDLV